MVSPAAHFHVSAQMDIRVIPRSLGWALLRFYLAGLGAGVLLGGAALLFIATDARTGIATVAFVAMIALGLVVVGHLFGGILFAKGPKWAVPIFSLGAALSPAVLYLVAGPWGVLVFACVVPIAIALSVQWTEPNAAR